MQSRRDPYYSGSQNDDWGRSRRSQSSIMYNSNNYHHYQQQPFQNRFPEEWKNPKLQEMKVKKIRQKQNRSAVNPLVKHFLFSVNVLFLVAGITITSFSIYVLTESDDAIGCFMDFIFSPACLLCLLGCLILVPSFMGCYGALREHTCILKMYYIIAIVLLLVEIALVIVFFIFTLVPDALANIGVYPEDFLDDAILEYGDRVHNEDGCGRDRDDYVDFIQDKFSCCGSSNDDQGYLDWNRNPYYRCNTSSTSPQACYVPISCCKADTTTGDCGANMLSPGHTNFSAIYLQGCEKGMRKVFEDNILAIGCGSVGGILLQIIFTCCAMRLNSQVLEQRSKW